MKYLRNEWIWDEHRGWVQDRKRHCLINRPCNLADIESLIRTWREWQWFRQPGVVFGIPKNPAGGEYFVVFTEVR